MPHGPYRRNYSPIKYEKDDIPDLFAAASRAGMRTPTFAQSGGVVFAHEPETEAHSKMDTDGSVRVIESTHKKALPKKPTHVHSVSPWFALASGMVVAGAVVMALVAVTPESLIPKGAIANLVSEVFTATVIFAP